MKHSVRATILGITTMAAFALSGCSGGSMVSPSGVTPATSGGTHTMGLGGQATIQRPYTDFVQAQGAEFFFLALTKGSKLPNCPTPGSEPAGFVDYLGQDASAAQVGTKITGTVEQTNNGDGTSTIHVDLDTTNAVASASCYNLATGNTPPYVDPGLYFGFTDNEVVAGAPAALATSHFSTTYAMLGTSPTMPLADITTIPTCTQPAGIPPAPAPCLETLELHAAATGALRQPFGVPDLTPGTMSMEQTGTFKIVGRAGKPAAIEGLTAAAVIVQQAK